MATATRPFSRNTSAETLAAVIRDEPEPLQSLVPDFPLALRWVIERCLAKDPDERYASTRDLARDLAHLREHISEVSQRMSVSAPARSRRFGRWTSAVPWLAAAAFAAVAALALLRSHPQPPVRLVRFTVPTPADVTYAPTEASRGFSISPDGTRLVIEAIANRRSHLYLQPLDSDRATELEGSLDATSHFWSPDGRFIAFFANGKLKKIPATGGRPADLCIATFGLLGTWGPDGSILFSRFRPTRHLSRARHRRRAGTHRIARELAERGKPAMASLSAGWPSIPLSRQRRSGCGPSRAATRVTGLERNPVGWVRYLSCRVRRARAPALRARRRALCATLR